MLKFKNLLSKSESSIVADVPVANSDKITSNISNWYADRYNSLALQRNLLLILLLASVVMVVASSFIVGSISSTFKIQPFVIEVEDKTGITNIVNPLANRELTTSEVLNRFFVMKYIKAREGYNFQTYKYNYFTVIRLLSDPGIYNDFKRFINNSADSPLALYGSQMSTYVAFRSIQFFPASTEPGASQDLRAIVRFTIFPENGTLKGTTGNRIHKILTLTYKYEQTEMNDDDRSENPLGFFITSYRADIENEDGPAN